MKDFLRLTLILLTSFCNVDAQTDKEYVFFSNLQSTELLDKVLKSGNDRDARVEFISLGDNSLQVLNQLSSECEDCKLRTVLGDKDLSQLLDGNEKVYDFKKKSLCPDPIVKELDDQHVMIIINSNWFIHREFQFKAQNFDCDFFNEIHLLEELEDILEDYKDWNKIVVTHHGMVSISEMAGKGIWMMNFIPIYGQLYQSFRKNIGYRNDLSSADYHNYISFLSKIFEKFDRLCVISGHDYLNHEIKDNYITHLNVNSSPEHYRYSKSKQTVFTSKRSHFLRLVKLDQEWQFQFSHQGTSKIVTDIFRKRPIEPKNTNLPSLPNKEVVSKVKASEKYDAGSVTKFFMGKGYREAWNTPVEAPFLDISTYHGGLRPYAIGGGLQTMSIKFKNPEGRKFAFRLLDKQPEKSLSDIARESVYRVIVQELITTMHPYGPLVANSLLDATDIMHIKPELFVLQDHPDLSGEFEPFVGKIGTLEEKPSGKKKNRKGFQGADKVVSSYEMFIALRKSHKNIMDPMAYAKARLMDMVLGDWDRHEDNWKWAMFKKDDQKVYYPIPKDRDHVFSKWTGLIPTLADMAINNAEDFDEKFGNFRHLNFKARFLDRELASEISLQTWLEAAEYLQEKLTDEVIDNAVGQFPKEVYEFHGEEIKKKLKGRRADLPRFITAYYKELSESVFITGTNKDDFFEIVRLKDGSVKVEVFDQKKDGSRGERFYERIFEPDIVNKIYCFGLDGEDVFEVEGDVPKSIKVRIIGGTDEDVIKDFSHVDAKGKLTQVYDSASEDHIQTSKETIVKRPSRPAHYDPYAFDYNWLIPKGTVRRSSGNGFGFGLGFTNMIRGFNKPGFAKKWDFGGVFYPSLKAYRLDAGYQFRHFVGLHDLVLRSRYSTLYDRYPFYYGIGNDTKVIRKKRRQLNRIDYDFLDFEAGLTTTFAQKSTWSSSLLFERHNVENFKDLNLLDASIEGFGIESFAGVKSELNLDFTDNSLYPEDGAQFAISLEGRSNFEGKLSSNMKTRFSYFKTLNTGFKTTLIGSLHYKQANGNPAFYHLSRLGSQTQFRGYTRNRFIDKYAMLYNTEIRVLLGTIKTPLIQFVVGVYGFYDGGRVWNDSSEFYEGEWNNSWGGGFFFAPGSTDYTLSFILARPEDDFTYSKLQLGFDF